MKVIPFNETQLSKRTQTKWQANDPLNKTSDFPCYLRMYITDDGKIKTSAVYQFQTFSNDKLETPVEVAKAFRLPAPEKYYHNIEYLVHSILDWSNAYRVIEVLFDNTFLRFNGRKDFLGNLKEGYYINSVEPHA